MIFVVTHCEPHLELKYLKVWFGCQRCNNYIAGDHTPALQPVNIGGDGNYSVENTFTSKF